MTEDKAKTKWCPFVRFEIGPSNDSWQSTAYTTRGVVMDGPRSFLCIASDCMLWRWEKARFVSEGVVEEVPIYGYCGLGGRP